jgi:hypothetical protein
MRIRALALLILASSIAAAAPVSAGGLDLRIVDSAGRPVPDAVVTVYPAGGVPRGGFGFAPGPIMVQENIAFVPHVLIVPVGAVVRFPNHDKVRHHIYSFSKPAKFEIKLFGKDESRSYTFTTAGTVALGCNIHDQMSGFIKVVDTPFAARSDAAGVIKLGGMAAGNAQIVVWHPNLRTRDNEQKSAMPIPASGSTARTLTLALAGR